MFTNFGWIQIVYIIFVYIYISYIIIMQFIQAEPALVHFVMP